VIVFIDEGQRTKDLGLTSNTCTPCSFPLARHNARNSPQEGGPIHDGFAAHRISFPSLPLVPGDIRLPKSFFFSRFCSSCAINQFFRY